MFLFGNFLEGLATVLSIVLTAYFWIVIISALLSWVNPDPYNPIVRALRTLTEPVFYRIRRWIPFVMVGGFDLSPIVVLLAIQFLQVFLVRSLVQLAHSM
ncbi:YggT family protein [Oceanidesulfovibrio indonesiensis]|uniref:YggT family protein n=1 Tax=Oceanidesulfovibrio indonesiensis TaxID=54767 RepID=A0A7M3MD04_9BACT|nr:YggT family protein [Oceanidesulfovibrio indonesiensis]TVM15965.1 YggT family protein [Oceanidesulfovibrio indonesiensis]